MSRSRRESINPMNVENSFSGLWYGKSSFWGPYRSTGTTPRK